METKRETSESRLYFPLYETLKELFDLFYVAESYTIDSKTGRRKAPSNSIRNPHLEITANGEVSEFLQSKFNYDLFQKLDAERLNPDLLGFVQKKPSSLEEFITVEVKRSPLRFRDVLQAKLYEEIFNAKFSFAISPKGMPMKKLKVILEHNKALRGNVIIAQCSDDGRSIWISPILKDYIPKEFRKLCRFNKY